MQSTKIGALSCCAQNYKQNTSFKAKFSNDTVANMGKENSSDYLKLYQDIFQVSEKVKDMGSKDTIVKIENPKDLTTVTETEDHSWESDAFYGYSDGHPDGPNYEPSYITNTIAKSEASLKFTHPLFENLESSVDFKQAKSISGNEYLAIAKDLDSATIEQGEENLAIAYVKDLMGKITNKGSLVEASKDFIRKLEQSDFNKKAITTIKNAVKSIDLKNKLDSRINQLLRL